MLETMEVLYRHPEQVVESTAMSIHSTSSVDSSINASMTLPPNLKNLHAQLICREVTPTDRLYYRRKSALDIIREKTEEPDKVLPQGRLPIWERIHLPHKVPAPNIPNHRVVWSRGKICQNILRQGACSGFCLDDRYSRYGIASGPYESLHDQNTKSYFQSPSIQKLLQDQGLITPRGSVPCSLSSFNGWRNQLHANIYTHEVKKALNQVLEMKEANALQLKTLAEYERRERFIKEQSGREQKQFKAREKAMNARMATLKKYEDGSKKKEERLRESRLKIAKDQLERMLRANRLQQKRQVVLVKLLNRTTVARQQLICRIVEKDVEAKRRLEAKNINDQRQLEEQSESRIQAHYQVQEIENEREKFVVEVVQREMAEATRLRQRNYDKTYRKSQETKSKNYRLELAKKYGRKWAELTGKRQLERCLIPYASLFNIPTELEATVQFLTKPQVFDTTNKGIHPVVK